MKKIGQLYNLLGNSRTVIISFIAFTVITVLMCIAGNEKLGAGGPSAIIMMEFSTSREMFMEQLATLGPSGIETYKNLLMVDYLYPVTYSVFIGAIIALVSKHLSSVPSKAALIFFTLPFVAAMLDFIENSLHLYFFANLDRLSEALILTATTVSVIKWFLPLLSSIYIIYSLSKLIYGTVPVKAGAVMIENGK